MTQEGAYGDTLRDLRRAARERRWSRELAHQLDDLPADDRERARARYVEEGFEGTMEELRSTLTHPVPDGAADAGLAGAVGLDLAYRALDAAIARDGLADAVVVLDDADLGRQVIRAGRRPLDGDLEALLDAPPGLHTEPPSPGPDAELVAALVRAAVRAAVLDEPPIEPLDALELALRRLPGVRAVGLDDDPHGPGAPVLQVVADVDAPPDVARRASRLAADHLPGPVALEVVRRGFGSAPAAGLGAPAAGLGVERPGSPVGAAAGAPEPAVPRLELVAVENVPEEGELEVHLRLGSARTVGRAPLARGLVGAVEATVDAIRAARGSLAFGAGWARTIETLPDRRFLVAVSLVDPDTRAARHGLAPGANPVEAAAKATLDALNRTLDAPADRSPGSSPGSSPGAPPSTPPG